MNEQQRIFLTVSLCAGIWLVWQLMFGPPPEPAAPAPAAALTEPSAAPTSSASVPRAADGNPTSPSATDVPSIAPQTRTFQTDLMVGTVANGSVRFVDLALPAFAAFDEEGGPTHVAGERLVAESIGQQAQIQVMVGGRAIAMDFASTDKADGSLTFIGSTADGVRVSMALAPAPDRYAVGCRLDVRNDSKQPVDAEVDVIFALPHGVPSSAREKGRSFLSSFGGQAPTLVQGFLLNGEKIQRKNKVTQAISEGSPTLRAAGLELPYFVLAWLPDAAERLSATFVPLEQAAHQLQRASCPNGLLLRATQTLGSVPAGSSRQSGAQLYFGPKRDAELMAVDVRLDGVIDYDMLGVPLGFLARPMMFFMRLFYQWTQSWGVAIIMLTLFVKLLLLPVNLKSGSNIRRMQALKPELDSLQKRFKSDPTRMQSEQIALYRKHNINPAAGCLPVVLQIPVWLTLYRSLASAVDLYKQPFLWLSDLTATEPVPMLALTAGAMTVVQQRLTPMAADSQQARIMMWVLPGLVTVFMINMPAGLTLYILVNSILTLLQQVVINRRAV